MRQHGLTHTTNLSRKHGVHVERDSAWSPASLFANGEAGDAWEATRDWCYTKSSGGVYEPVTTSGDLVARMSGTVNGTNADQDDLAKRPAYTEGGGLSWLDFDGVDDVLNTPDSFAIENPWSFITGSDAVVSSNKSASPIMSMGGGSNLFAFGYRSDFRITIASRLLTEGVGLSLEHTFVTALDVNITTASFQNGIMEVRTNGVDLAACAQNLTTQSSSGRPISIGGNVIGNFTPAPLKFFGGIAVSSELTPNQFAAAESYLANLSGVTLP